MFQRQTVIQPEPDLALLEGGDTDLYLRVSTGRQASAGTSLETQESEARKFLAQNGHSVRRVWREVESGADYNRPVLQDLMKAARNKQVKRVLAYDFDRLSRDQTDSVVILHYFKLRDIPVEFVTGKLDDTPMGRYVQQTLAFVAEFERAKILERTSRGRRYRAESGVIHPGSFPAFGYFYADETRRAYVIDPEASRVIVWIFERAAEGWSGYRIAGDLNARGIETPTQYFDRIGILPPTKHIGVKWLRASVINILDNEAYKGEMDANRWKTTKVSVEDEYGEMRTVKQMRKRPEEERIRIGSPAIVSPALWEAANAGRQLNKAEAARNNKNVERTLLRGSAVCGYCKNRAYAFTRGNGIPYYVCSHMKGRYKGVGEVCPEGCYTVRAEVVDADVWAKVLKLLDDAQAVRRAVAAYHAQTDERNTAEADELAVRTGELEKLKRKRRTINLRLEDADELDAEERAENEERLAEVRLQIGKLTTQIDRLHSARASRDSYTAVVDALEAWADDVRSDLALRGPDVPFEVKRNVLRVLGVKVPLYRMGTTPIEPVFGFEGVGTGVHCDTRLLKL
jgi:site-specific DNA recombinase